MFPSRTRLLVCFTYLFSQQRRFSYSFSLLLVFLPFTVWVPFPLWSATSWQGLIYPLHQWRGQIKNLCHPHDRPEKLASHLNIAKNWVICYISDRRMGLLIYVKGNWIQVVLSLADVQRYFCQLVVKLKRDIFLRIETWNNNVLKHRLIMLSHKMDEILLWKDANDTRLEVFVGSGEKLKFCSAVYFWVKMKNNRDSFLWVVTFLRGLLGGWIIQGRCEFKCS